MQTDRKARLVSAAMALQQGDNARARQLLIVLLKENPQDAHAWRLAASASETDEARRYCLKRALALDPADHALRDYVAQLEPDAAVHPTAPPPPATPVSSTRPRRRWWDILLTPLNLLMQLPPLVVLGFLTTCLILGGYIYYRANTSFFGLAAPDFENFTISGDYTAIDAGDVQWEIIYEADHDVTFEGAVRHVSHWRRWDSRLLTHDVLVTSGDYADPQAVKTRVFNHHATATWPKGEVPQGTINLLHAVPLNPTIYQQLLKLRVGDHVAIRGQEILRINTYVPEEGAELWWQDDGCNTILVKSVEIIDE